MNDDQLVLDLPEREQSAPQSFVTGASTASARAALSRWRAWPGRVLALVAPAHSGKSHLARIWAGEVGGRVVSRAGFAAAAPAVIVAARTAPIAVEDLDRGVDERALLGLLDEARSGAAAAVLLTARSRPTNWPIALGDLRSRLAAAPVVGFDAPDDAELDALLPALLRARGLDVNAAVIEYLQRRIERTTAAAVQVVRRLDRASLARRAPVSRALARSVLGDRGEEDETGDEFEDADDGRDGGSGQAA